MASPARAESPLLRLGRAGIELHAIPPRPPGGAAWPAIDACRPDCVDESSVGTMVTVRDGTPRGAGVDGRLHGPHVSGVPAPRLPGSFGQTVTFLHAHSVPGFRLLARCPPRCSPAAGDRRVDVPRFGRT